ITITETPVPEAPVLTAANATAARSEERRVGTEGSTMAPTYERDLDATNTVTITGVPTTATLSAGTNNGGGSWTLTQAQLAGLTLTAGDDDVTSISLQVTATATEGGTTASSATQTINITENPVPEAPVLTAANATAASSSVNEGGTVALTIAPTYESDLDASFPTRRSSDLTTATLSAGTNNGGGSWTLTQAQLAGLTLTAGDDDVT